MLLLYALALALGVSQDLDLLKRGEDLLRHGQHAEAEALFEEAVRKEPESARAHYYLGVARMRLGRAEEALPALERSRELARTANPAVLLELGAVYLRVGRYQEAARTFEEARTLVPEDASVRLQLGFAYYKLLDGERAEAELRAILAKDPSHAVAYFYLGLAEAALGKLGDASVSFRKALELEPDFADARIGLARSLSQAGRDEEARTELESVLRAETEGSPSALSARNELGLIALRSQEFDTALRHFEAVVEGRPDDRQATYNLWLLYTRLGHSGEAEEMRRRFESAQDDPIELRSLARTSSKKNPR